MPATPWTPVAPATTTDVHVVATEFHLPRLRDTLRFLRATRRITAQMGAAEGLVGYALQARVLSRTYRTVSIWDSRDHARAFAREGEHARIAPLAWAGGRPSSMARWDAPAADPPPSWTRVEQALRPGSVGVASTSGSGVGSGG